MPDFIDVHSHLNFKDFDTDRGEAISRLKASKTWTITVGTDFETSKGATELAASTAEVFACVGLHPADNTVEVFDEKKYEDLLKEPKVVAIGECGLDYFHIKEKTEEGIKAIKQNQKEIFEKQINLALKYDKPLMIHCRDAYSDVHEILSSYKKQNGEKLRGNIHFFAGSIDDARKFLDLDFTLSFTGVITFAKSYDEVIRFAPIEMIMSETDAPFVSPAPYRGKRNEPSYVSEVVKRIAEIREEPLEEVKKALVSNAFRVFGLRAALGPTEATE